VELDTANNVVRLARWVAGSRVQVKEVAFTSAPGEEIWLGADWREGDRLKVYGSKVEGNLIRAANLLIAEDDATLARGGHFGVGAKECNARFFLVRAGSAEHAHTAEYAYLAAQAEHAAEADHATEADALTASPFPAGCMLLWSTASAPTGWLLCDGAAVSRQGYTALYNVIGTTFGAGDGSTTFNLPDFQGRSPQGKDGTDALGAKVGTKLQTEVPQHSHQILTRDTSTGGSARVKSVVAGGTEYIQNTGNTGTAGGVDQRGPRLAVNFIIKT